MTDYRRPDEDATVARQQHEVEAPVNRIILEKTGEMRELTHTVTLKGVVCTGLCSKNCPQKANVDRRDDKY